MYQPDTLFIVIAGGSFLLVSAGANIISSLVMDKLRNGNGNGRRHCPEHAGIETKLTEIHTDVKWLKENRKNNAN